MTEPLGIEYFPPEPAPQAGPSGEKWLTFSPTAARAALELIALGKSLFEIEREPNLPPAGTFIQWVMLYPMLARAYATARELSGFMLEEEALFIARKISTGEYTATQIKAHEVLLNQLKWSAGKRNPQVFSDKAALNITVPIQINTTLDLGEGHDGSTKQFPNIYEMTANMEQEVPLDEVPLDTIKGDTGESAGRKARAAPRKASSEAKRTREATDVSPQDERDDARRARNGRGAHSSRPPIKGRQRPARGKPKDDAQDASAAAEQEPNAVSRGASGRDDGVAGEE